MSVASAVLCHAMSLDENTIFTRRDLVEYGKANAIDQALYRYCKAGMFVRLARGLYTRPYPGLPLPSIEEVAVARIKAFGRCANPTAVEEARLHGLSDKGDAVMTFEVDGASSRFMVYATSDRPGALIRVIRRVARKTKLAETKARRAIKALWAIDDCTDAFIERAVANLTNPELREFKRSHRWMPEWLSAKVHDLFPSTAVLSN